MLRLRDHIIALAAVFLSLGTGLFLGISLGESIIVSNQMEIIEKLETRLYSYYNQVEELKDIVAVQQEVIEKWHDSEEVLFPFVFQDLLNGHNVALISIEDTIPDDLKNFFQLTGAQSFVVTESKNISSAESYIEQTPYLFDDFWQYLFGREAGSKVLELLNNNHLSVEGIRSEEYSAIIILLPENTPLTERSFLHLSKKRYANKQGIYSFYVDKETNIICSEENYCFSFSRLLDCLYFLEAIELKSF